MKRDPQTLQDSIRNEAYLLSEKAGHPPGMADIFWLKAEAMVLQKSAPTGKSASSMNGNRKVVPRSEAKRAAPVQSRRNKSASGQAPALR